jgi:hypothetical protein
MTHEEERLWLIEKLKGMNPSCRLIPVPADEQGQKDALRVLMNVWMPGPLSAEFIEVQNSYLRKESILKGIVDERMLKPCGSDPRLYIWQGDITRLKADAITNAAKRFWRQGLFSDIEIALTKIYGDKAWLELRLTPQPRISQINYYGVKKTEIEDLESRLGLAKGQQITPNIIDRAEMIIKKYFD